MGQQVRIYGKTKREVAKKFKNEYKDRDIYDITREVPKNTKPNERFFRVTSVNKGRLPKSRLSAYNFPKVGGK